MWPRVPHADAKGATTASETSGRARSLILRVCYNEEWDERCEMGNREGGWESCK